MIKGTLFLILISNIILSVGFSQPLPSSSSSTQLPNASQVNFSDDITQQIVESWNQIFYGNQPEAPEDCEKLYIHGDGIKAKSFQARNRIYRNSEGETTAIGGLVDFPSPDGEVIDISKNQHYSTYGSTYKIDCELGEGKRDTDLNLTIDQIDNYQAPDDSTKNFKESMQLTDEETLTIEEGSQELTFIESSTEDNIEKQQENKDDVFGLLDCMNDAVDCPSSEENPSGKILPMKNKKQ